MRLVASIFVYIWVYRTYIVHHKVTPRYTHRYMYKESLPIQEYTCTSRVAVDLF